MPGTITRDELAALADDIRAELAAADGQERARILARPRQQDPRVFSRYPWTWQAVPPGEVAALTGYAPASVRVYRGQAVKARAAGTETHRHMPAELPGGGYEAGALAIWLATRDEGRAQHLLADDTRAAAILADYQAREGMRKGALQAAGLTNEMIAARHGVSVSTARAIGSGRAAAQGRAGTLGARQRRREKQLLPAVAAIGRRDGEVTCAAVAAELGIAPQTAKSLIGELAIPLTGETAPDGDVSAFIAGVLRGPGQHKTASRIYRRARAAGVRASPRQVARLLPVVRAAVMAEKHTPAGQGRARGESLRPDGLLTTAELAADWQVSPGAITQARRRGDITPAGRDGNRPLWDGANMRARSDSGQRGRTPVDKGHRLAVPLPGDQDPEP